MSTKPIKSSWVAFALFYLILVLIITILDLFNGVLTLTYWVEGDGFFQVVHFAGPDDGRGNTGLA